MSALRTALTEYPDRVKEQTHADTPINEPEKPAQETMAPTTAAEFPVPTAVAGVVAQLDSAQAKIAATFDAAVAEVGELRKLYDLDVNRIRIEIKALGALGASVEDVANYVRDRARDLRSSRATIIKGVS